MKVVKVYGALRKKLGQCRFEFYADTPAQALKALCVNFPGLDRWFVDREGDGMHFRVTVGREKITNAAPEGLVLPWSEREVFSITPVVTGAGEGFTNVLIGIGLIAVSFLLPGAGAFGTTSIFGATAATAGTAGALTTLATSLSLIGASLILTGVAQMISPQPELGFNTGKEAARLESFTFSGIVNTSKQGLPVPIAYGRVFTGSAVISSGLDVDQLRSNINPANPTIESLLLGFIGNKGA
jgi:predicted phage tail protein